VNPGATRSTSHKVCESLLPCHPERSEGSGRWKARPALRDASLWATLRPESRFYERGCLSDRIYALRQRANTSFLARNRLQSHGLRPVPQAAIATVRCRISVLRRQGRCIDAKPEMGV
jgi:hypothetical protein